MSEPQETSGSDNEADRLRARLGALDALLASGDLTDEEYAVARRLAIFGSGAHVTQDELKLGKPEAPKRPLANPLARNSRRVAYGSAAVIAVIVLAPVAIFALRNGATDTDPANGSGAEPTSAVETADAREAAAGLPVFEATCQGCHLDKGTGADGVGPRLSSGGLSAADIRWRIENGVGGMPGGLLSGADLTNVVQYVLSIQ